VSERVAGLWSGFLKRSGIALSSGYRLEIERMQGEILDYLSRPMVPEPAGH
jgi:hypothetical protein